MKRLFFTAICVFLLFICLACKTSFPDEMPLELKSKIEKLNFRIRVSDMAPQRYISRVITSVYGIEVKDGWMNSNLPYLGQVQMPSIYTAIPKGLNFKEEIRECSTVDNPKKHREEINIYVRNEEDRYLYSIYIYYDGKAEIMVRPAKRDFIRFYGDVEQ